jgi:hypothetical protein
MARKLVTEKRENAGTAVKSGLFWAALAAIPLLIHRARRKAKKRRLFRRK